MTKYGYGYQRERERRGGKVRAPRKGPQRIKESQSNSYDLILSFPQTMTKTQNVPIK